MGRHMISFDDGALLLSPAAWLRTERSHGRSAARSSSAEMALDDGGGGGGRHSVAAERSKEVVSMQRIQSRRGVGANSRGARHVTEESDLAEEGAGIVRCGVVELGREPPRGDDEKRSPNSPLRMTTSPAFAVTSTRAAAICSCRADERTGRPTGRLRRAGSRRGGQARRPRRARASREPRSPGGRRPRRAPEAFGQAAAQSGRPHAARARRAAARRQRPHDTRHRRPALHLAEDRRSPHPAHLQQDRRLDAGGCRSLGDAARTALSCWPVSVNHVRPWCDLRASDTPVSE